MKTVRFSTQQLEQEVQQTEEDGDARLVEAMTTAENLDFLLRHPELKLDDRYFQAMENIRTKLYSQL